MFQLFSRQSNRVEEEPCRNMAQQVLERTKQPCLP